MTEERKNQIQCFVERSQGKKQDENGKGETEILLESFGHKSEKVVHTRGGVRKDSS